MERPVVCHVIPPAMMKSAALIFFTYSEVVKVTDGYLHCFESIFSLLFSILEITNKATFAGQVTFCFTWVVMPNWLINFSPTLRFLQRFKLFTQYLEGKWYGAIRLYFYTINFQSCVMHQTMLSLREWSMSQMVAANTHGSHAWTATVAQWGIYFH